MAVEKITPKKIEAEVIKVLLLFLHKFRQAILMYENMICL
jgi:hypothetical protein